MKEELESKVGSMRTTMEQMDRKIEEAMAASESELEEDEESE